MFVKKFCTFQSICIILLLLISNIMVAAAINCNNDLDGVVMARPLVDGEYLDVEYINLGSDVYITGFNWNQELGPVRWEVRDMDDDTNGPDKPVVSRYSDDGAPVNPDGTIDPVKIFTIPSDDYENHDYRLDAWQKDWEVCMVDKQDFFKTKKDTFYSVPEFPVVALPVAIMLGFVFIISTKRKNQG